MKSISSDQWEIGLPKSMLQTIGDAEIGYCSRLCNIFQWVDPICLKVNDILGGILENLCSFGLLFLIW